ncbi:unnamed protein product [Rhizoctonia solani]|uniref:Uncharacterized protein n=1 Tax=Rhizoctonia solani TaxID=456999 RepID=A0A8H3BVR7_9AGAM|nr:unnamed protein product [Rhizoctonia solani]
MLTTCNGGDSSKRCAAAGTADRWKYNSSYYLTPEEVNVFKHEVPTRKRKESVSQAQGEVTDPSECKKHWKNAKVDNNPDRKTRSIFDETGIFISVCRHSFILTICDMIQSGEQAKYPLAIIDKLMSVYGPDIMMGYNIGCTFKGTAEWSPLLGQRVKEMGFDMCLGSFHGPAHNRLCQLRNHPHNREGNGLSPLENAEQIFSSSNRIASLVRLASKYHRQQCIHMHFNAWDEDQHQNLGYLLHTKYIRALEEYKTAESTMAKLRPGILATKLEEYIEQEKAYLESLKAPLESELFTIEYLGLLEKLEAKRAEYDHCQNASFIATDGPLTGNLRQSALKTAKIETRRRNTLEQLLTVQDAVAKLEEKHNITHRWTRTSKEWIEAQKTRKDQQYHAAIDELERLVIQRLFELSRAGLANTGYKLRQHILKAIYVRSKAVRAALDRYNKLASELVPPSCTISWDSIANSKVLEDFNILRGSRWGIEEEEWSKLENRHCTEQAR